MSGPAAARTAATRPASSPMPTLTFTQPKPARAAAAASARRSRPVLGAQRRVHRDPLGRARREQVRHRPPGPPPGAVPQREIDRRERRREVALGRAGREQLGVAGPGVHAAQHLAVGVERRGDRAEETPS